MKTHKHFYDIPQPVDLPDKYHVFNKSNILNTLYWFDIAKVIEKVDGVIVECGVGRARSLINLIVTFNLYSNFKGFSKRKIFAFDSFEGFCEPSVHDISIRNPQKGQWARSPKNEFEYNEENIIKVIKSAGLIEEVKDVSFIKGFFQETTKQFDDKIALLHLDGDLYESIISPLNNLSKHVVSGGVILFDDFILEDPEQNNERWPGARKAFYEFISKNNSYEIKTTVRGNPYLIKA